MAVMTPTAQRTAINWLRASIEMAKRQERSVSGAAEEREILETIEAMLAERKQSE